VIYAVESEFIAVVIPLDKAPATTAHRLESFEAGGQTVRSQPLGVDLRVRMGLEDQIHGCIELPGDEELLFAGFGGDNGFVLFVRHVNSPFFNYR